MPTTVQEVKWGEDNPIDAVPVLSDEEKETLRLRILAMDKLLADQQKAKYKIEILFTSTRRPSTAYIGALSFWESGTKLHGGGDTKVYECPGKRLKINECMGFIPDSSTGYGFLHCPECKKVWQGEQVSGEVFARLTTPDWARLLQRYFIRLGHNADIYMKYPKEDLRKATALENSLRGGRGGEILARARGGRQRVIYPLAHIIKDTANGADIFTQFRKFLSA